MYKYIWTKDLKYKNLYVEISMFIKAFKDKSPLDKHPTGKRLFINVHG